MNGWLSSCVLLTALALSGCATPLQKLAAPLIEDEKASAVVIYLEQTEVAIDDVDVQNAGGGLIGALVEGIVESAMTSNRQKAIAPLRDVLLDYDYENRLVDAVRQHLPSALVRADASFKIIRNDEEWLDHLRSVVPANVLVIKTRYGFEQNFEIAYVYASADLSHWHRVPPDKHASYDKRKAAKPTILHRGSYYSQHVTRNLFEKLIKGDGLSGYETDAVAWASDGAEPARKAFSVALNEVAQLIQSDAQGQLSTPAEPTQMRIMAANAYFQPMSVWSDLLVRNNNRALVTFGQHHLWIDQRQIKRER